MTPARGDSLEPTQRWARPFNRIWRIFGTGASFTLFGFGGLVIGLLVFPPIWLCVREPVRRRRLMQYVVHLSFRGFIEFMCLVGVMSYQVKGREKLQAGGQLIIANHPTLIDVVLLIAQIPHCNCVVKQALFRNPFTRGPVVAAGYVANDGSAAFVDHCLAVLARGESLIVFPEGTRSTPGQRSKFRRGTANIALRAGAALRPVIIDVQPSTLTKGLPWYQVPVRRFHMRMQVHEPIDVQAFASAHGNLNLAARALTEHLQDYLWTQRQQLQADLPTAPQASRLQRSPDC